MTHKHKGKAPTNKLNPLQPRNENAGGRAAAAERRIKPEIVVVTTALLGFISFWRAAAIVLCDLGSSAFYAGGIAEGAIGKAAPWFILSIMLFSYAVRAIYVESCSMFVRGGVYRVVKEAMGAPMAKFSVSALLFDYILTGPISAVSAGQYLVGLGNDTLKLFHFPAVLPPNLTAALVAILVTLYFWWKNVQGIEESSDKAMTIMKITTVMVVMILVWCGITLIIRGGKLPPFSLSVQPEALGWIRHAPSLSHLTWVIVLVGLGHSVLAMSGEETLAQVYREIGHPKLPNLQRTGLVIFAYSLVFTASVSFLAVMIIPDEMRKVYLDNLISGLAMNVVGPYTLRLFFQAFVVVVGFLILAGAVNTAIVGSNGVLNRISEDGILPSWFREPHQRYGTTYRMINMIALLQLLTIVVSRGNIDLLGQAYAFGVVWSFALKALAMLVLRFTEPGHQEWKVPGNLRIGRVEIPIGLGIITLVLFLIALVNLVSKDVSTISGLSFTVFCFIVLSISERIMRRRTTIHREMDEFALNRQEAALPAVVRCRPGSLLVPLRDYNNLTPLKRALETTETEQRDIVVMTSRLNRGPDVGERDLYNEHLFTEYEKYLFSQVVAMAEKEGKPVKLLVLPANDVFEGILQTAINLQCSEVMMGRSEKMSPDLQSKLLGNSWQKLSNAPKIGVVIVSADGREWRFELGPHAPRFRPEDIGQIHDLWLELSKEKGLDSLHHREVVAVAMQQLVEDLKHGKRGEIIAKLREIRKKTDSS
ncbi:MAG: APC family permease [Acidobacteria bacterium]|nr:APC family permease [Acidobacteriota bacterium]MBI3657735.1 APC family permease [Acidobacteriota bacterium]